MKLISFSVANYRSFYGEQVIEFNSKDSNVYAIFGPNASGKSNLYKAMHFVNYFIPRSNAFKEDKQYYEPFLLNQDAINVPTEFCMELEIGNYIYNYSFSLHKMKIRTERLQRKNNKDDSKYITIFSRGAMKNGIYSKYGFSSELLNKTRDDALVLTTGYETNNKIAISFYEWFKNCNFLTNSDINITAKAITEKPEYKERVLELLVRADLSIHDFSVSKLRMPDKMYDSLPIIDEVKSKIDRMVFGVSTFHLVRDNTDNVAGLRQMDMKRHESMGTQRIFDLAYPLLDTLDNGKVLYIDEFETYLHPRESAFIIDLFKSAENKNGAQLIVNTHNKQIMDQIGRNNIFLVDKNFKEESIIGKIKTARTDDRNLEKKYDKGFFGAVPDVRINL